MKTMKAMQLAERLPGLRHRPTATAAFRKKRCDIALLSAFPCPKLLPAKARKPQIARPGVDDRFANGNRRRSRRRRHVEHVQHFSRGLITRGHKMKVVDQRAVRLERLGAHAGATGHKILLAHVGNKTLQGTNKKWLR